jgi:hypothetical protein
MARSSNEKSLTKIAANPEHSELAAADFSRLRRNIKP